MSVQEVCEGCPTWPLYFSAVEFIGCCGSARGSVLVQIGAVGQRFACAAGHSEMQGKLLYCPIPEVVVVVVARAIVLNVFRWSCTSTVHFS